MKVVKISSAGVGRAIVIFAGWGMDETPFAHLERQGYDIFVVYDYTDTNLNPVAEATTHYDELVVIAWSWGVPSAARFLASPHARAVTLSIAVNGTLMAVDDTRGIPHATYEGTLANLSDATLRKFYRRMCSSSAEFADFAACVPKRDIEDLRHELEALGRADAETDNIHLFDIVIIADGDRIIPPDNQRRCWQGHPGLVETTGAHLPDFSHVIDKYVRDKQLVATRFKGACATYDSEADAQRDIACHAVELLREVLPAKLDDAIEFGVGTGMFTALYRPLLPNGCRLRLLDIAPCDDNVEQADAETAFREMPTASVDLVLGTSTLQWFNSPARFLRQVYRVLRPGGAAVITTFAPRHFAEISPMLSVNLRYADGATLCQGIDGARWHEQTITKQFDTPAALLRHLQRSGVNAISTSAADTRTILRRGVKTLTYNPLFITITKK